MAARNLFLSDQWEINCINHVLKRSTITVASTMQLRISTDLNNPDGGADSDPETGSNVVEPTGTPRVSTNPSDWNSATGRKISNAVDLVFPTTAGAYTARWFALYRNGTDYIGWAKIDPAVSVAANEGLKVAAGDIDFTIFYPTNVADGEAEETTQQTSLSNHAANKILDLIFNKAGWTVPGVYLGLSQMDPITVTTSTSAIQELDYGGYARIQRQGSTHWDDPSTHEAQVGGGTPNTKGHFSRNVTMFFWPEVTAINTYDTINYVFGADSATIGAGNLLFFTNSGGGAENIQIGFYPAIRNTGLSNRADFVWY